MLPESRSWLDLCDLSSPVWELRLIESVIPRRMYKHVIKYWAAGNGLFEALCIGLLYHILRTESYPLRLFFSVLLPLVSSAPSSFAVSMSFDFLL